ncbi:NYN domain-containing protein [Candidatus Gracilibacteria bacterium]|nr:NYN domain-containing protein [Candidatus Gracilibacteria bacterium]
MKNYEKNCAYIDGANLHKGIYSLGWKLDYLRFRIWLKEKYFVDRAYIFIGFIAEYKNLYNFLEKVGFILVFKEAVQCNDGTTKGNCDADLVLCAVKGFYENAYEKAIIISSDGDYASLVKFLLSKEKLKILLSPYKRCSILLKKTNAPIAYLSNKKDDICYNCQK